jgi:hypothetical protein
MESTLRNKKRNRLQSLARERRVKMRDDCNCSEELQTEHANSGSPFSRQSWILFSELKRLFMFKINASSSPADHLELKLHIEFLEAEMELVADDEKYKRIVGHAFALYQSFVLDSEVASLHEMIDKWHQLYYMSHVVAHVQKEI